MAKVLTNVFAVGGKEVKRTYAIYGGLIPPFTMELHGERYIMPGWYKLKPEEAMPNIKDIAFYPYKPKKPNLPNIDSNKVYKVKSSKGNSFYEVKMNASGSMECSCPGYGFRRKCRHIAETLQTSI